MLAEGDNHQRTGSPEYLRVSDLIRAMIGVNWVITDFNQFNKVSTNNHGEGFRSPSSWRMW